MSDEIQRYKRALAKQRRMNRELEDALAQAVQMIEEAPDASDLQAQLDQLHEAMAEGAYRVAWEAAATEAGVDPERFDDLWALAPPEIDRDGDPDPAKLKAHVAESVASRKSFVTGKPAKDGKPDAGADAGEGEGDDDEGEEIEDGADPFRHFAKFSGGDGAAGGGGKAKGKAGPALTDGEGAARGGRAGKDPGPHEQLERDFAATGRTDAFRL